MTHIALVIRVSERVCHECFEIIPAQVGWYVYNLFIIRLSFFLLLIASYKKVIFALLFFSGRTQPMSHLEEPLPSILTSVWIWEKLTPILIITIRIQVIFHKAEL